MQIVLENTKSFLKWAFVFQVLCNFFQQRILSSLLKYLLVLKTEDKPSKLTFCSTISGSHSLCLTPQGLLHLSGGITLTLARSAGTMCRAKLSMHHRNPRNKEWQTFHNPAFLPGVSRSQRKGKWSLSAQGSCWSKATRRLLPCAQGLPRAADLSQDPPTSPQTPCNK